MLRSSLTVIIFEKSQNSTSFDLHNDSQSIIIYQVTTNNLGAVEVTPNCGFIRPSSALSLEVRRIYKKNQHLISQSHKRTEYSRQKDSPFHTKNIQDASMTQTTQSQPSVTIKKSDSIAKLRIAWSCLQKAQRSLNFKLVWKDIPQKSKQYMHLQIRCNTAKQMHRKSQDCLDINHIDTQQSICKSISSGKIDIQADVSAETRSRLILQMTNELQQQLRNEQSLTLQLEQKIFITQQKLKQVTQQRLEIKVHKSINIICEEPHQSFQTFVALGMISFLLGYLCCNNHYFGTEF